MDAIEALLQTVDERYPCREVQSRQLAHLTWVILSSPFRACVSSLEYLMLRCMPLTMSSAYATRSRHGGRARPRGDGQERRRPGGLAIHRHPACHRQLPRMHHRSTPPRAHGGRGRGRSGGSACGGACRTSSASRVGPMRKYEHAGGASAATASRAVEVRAGL